MTYQELKLSLEKCERSLKSIQDGTYKNLSKINVKETTNKLKVLKESLSAKLKEAEETMFVTTKGGDTKAIKMDRKAAMDLKKDPNVVDIDTAKGQDLKEGVKFSKEETMAIAKDVGKAVAKALNDVGDEVAHMKAKDISEGSFEIYVEYKNGSDDQFSFYISDDTLHLQDFSFDKELVDVGVKPSGEAIVHVDVLANELVKHFKSVNEGMTDQEYADAKEKERLEKHPERDTIKKIQALIAAEKAKSQVKEAPEGMYYIKIPKDAASQNKAQVIFNDLYGIEYETNDAPDGIFMYFKKEDFNPGVLEDLEGDQVEILATNIPVNGNEDYDPDQAQKDDEEEYERGYDDDGLPLGENEAEDQGGDLDVGHQDDEPDMLKQYAYDIAIYASKLYKQLDKYDKMDGEVDFPNWWQSKVILAKDYISKAQHYLEFEEKQPAIDQLALEAQSHPVMVQQRIAHAKKAKKKDQGASKGQETEFHKKLDTLVHNTFGKRKEEMDENRFLAASMEDLEQVIRNLAHTGEMSEDEAIELAIKKLEAMLDGRDDLEEGQAAIKKQLDKIDQALKQHKERTIAIAKTPADQRSEEDKEHLAKMAELTKKKKQLLDKYGDAVAGLNRNQELTEQACSCCGDNPCSCDESCPHCGGKGLYEEKATYCGACGKTHKKSQSCPK